MLEQELAGELGASNKAAFWFWGSIPACKIPRVRLLPVVPAEPGSPTPPVPHGHGEAQTPANLQVSQSDWWKSHALDKNGIRAPRRAASSK